MKDFPIPIVAVGIGPGSQVDDDALNYLSMPEGMQTFRAPLLPQPQEVIGRPRAHRALRETLAQLERVCAGAGNQVVDLQGLPAVKGRFEQTDARGGVAGGDLYLSRPGKARFAYDPPSSRLVISDGHWVGISDPRLKTFSRYPLWSTPLSLFLAKTVRLDKGVVVDRVTRTADGFSLSAVDARHRSQGRITLTFGKDPVRLQEWTLTDAQGQVTRVRLTGLEPVAGLDPSLFVLHGAAPPPVADEADSAH